MSCNRKVMRCENPNGVGILVRVSPLISLGSQTNDAAKFLVLSNASHFFYRRMIAPFMHGKDELIGALGRDRASVKSSKIGFSTKIGRP